MSPWWASPISTNFSGCAPPITCATCTTCRARHARRQRQGDVGCGLSQAGNCAGCGHRFGKTGRATREGRQTQDEVMKRPRTARAPRQRKVLFTLPFREAFASWWNTTGRCNPCSLIQGLDWRRSMNTCSSVSCQRLSSMQISAVPMRCANWGAKRKPPCLSS